MPFADIVGHEAAIRLLKAQVRRGRLAHSYLFVGLEGIGRRTLALELARALQCGSPRDAEPCGECEGCRQVVEGKHPDVRVVSPGTENDELGIDQVRDLVSWMMLTPFVSERKVAILDQAERATEQATHACLKILEEAPAGGLFILVAPGTHRLPATLVSRCYVVRLRPQGVEKVAEWLEKREGLAPAQARMLAVSSGGRLGLALQFHRAERLKRLNASLQAILEARRRRELEVSLGRISREEVAEALEWYASWWRDLAVLALGGAPQWVIHQDRLQELQRAAGSTPVDSLLEEVERAFWVEDAVQKNAQVRTGLSVLLARG